MLSAVPLDLLNPAPSLLGRAIHLTAGPLSVNQETTKVEDFCAQRLAALSPVTAENADTISGGTHWSFRRLDVARSGGLSRNGRGGATDGLAFRGLRTYVT